MKRKLLHFVIPLLGAALFVAPACQQAPQNVAELEHVAEAAHESTGRTVTVEGRVNRVLGDCAFELENSELLFPDRVLTLCEPAGAGEAPPQAPAEVKLDDWLRVTGVAGEMTREDYEFKTTLTLSDDVFGERETRPVILVETAERIEPPELESPQSLQGR